MDGVKAFTIMMEDREVMKVDFGALKYDKMNVSMYIMGPECL